MIYPTMLLEEQLQDERLARAQAALQRGEMTVQPINACTWIVASKGSQYTVTVDRDASRKDTPWQEHQGLRGTVWACTCPDFASRCRRFHLLCKHISAVRFAEAQRASEAANTSFLNMEEMMTQPAISKHLKKLKQAKIIDSEQNGLWTNYYISKGLSKQTITVLDHFRNLLKNDKIVKNDLKMAKVVNTTLCKFS